MKTIISEQKVKEHMRTREIKVCAIDEHKLNAKFRSLKKDLEVIAHKQAFYEDKEKENNKKKARNESSLNELKSKLNNNTSCFQNIQEVN